MQENTESKKCPHLFMKVYCMEKMVSNKPIKEEETYCWVIPKKVIPYARI